MVVLLLLQIDHRMEIHTAAAVVVQMEKQQQQQQEEVAEFEMK